MPKCKCSISAVSVCAVCELVLVQLVLRQWTRVNVEHQNTLLSLQGVLWDKVSTLYAGAHMTVNVLQGKIISNH